MAEANQTEEALFTVVGIRPPETKQNSHARFAGATILYKSHAKAPAASIVLLCGIVLCCLFAELLMTKDPSYLDPSNHTHAPDSEFLFGTDSLGRDIFSCIWYGGRISLWIGFFSTALSTLAAVIYGTISGIAPARLDALLMRMAEIFLSVPNLLVVLFVQAAFGKPNVFSIAAAIGLTSWCSIAKIIRTEVRMIRGSEYVLAAKCMGGGFFHILGRHYAPNFISSILFMVVMNIRSAIIAESTLSFLGMGLPLDVVSWGSMLSLAEDALLTHAWWIILIPGAFLVTVLVCMTNLGNWLGKHTIF